LVANSGIVYCVVADEDPAVMNVDLNVLERAVPVELVTPATVSVYMLFGVNAAPGVNVAVLLLEFQATVPATALMPVSVMLVVFTVAELAAPENVIVMVAFVATSLAPDAGVTDITLKLPADEEPGFEGETGMVGCELPHPVRAMKNVDAANAEVTKRNRTLGPVTI
jgi:hypothetical protein